MEKTLYILIPVFIFVMGVIVSVLGYLIVRLFKGFDERITKIECKTDDISAIREALDWIKDELHGYKKRRK